MHMTINLFSMASTFICYPQGKQYVLSVAHYESSSLARYTLRDFRHTQLQRKMTYKIMVMPWVLRGQSRLKAKCCGVHAGPICSKQGLFSTAKKQTSVPACPQTQRSVLVYHRLAEQISHPCSHVPFTAGRGSSYLKRFVLWMIMLISHKVSSTFADPVLCHLCFPLHHCPEIFSITPLLQCSRPQI